MTDVKFIYIDNSDIYIECDNGILMEMHEEFSFYVKGYKFMPTYKSGRWSGKIHLINRASGTCGIGLIDDIAKFCKNRNYSFKIDNKLIIKPVATIEQIKTFITYLKLPFELRDYQLLALIDIINKKRVIVSISTGGGKSLVLYVAFRWLQKLNEKILLVVPNVSLLSQMSTDFDSYAINDSEWNSDKYCHLISAGIEKDTDKPITISTFQSLMKQSKSWFKSTNFNACFSDECHMAKSKEISKIVTACNSETKIGLSGTPDGGDYVAGLTLKSLFGEIIQYTTTKSLMNAGTLSTLNIKGIVLNYKDKVKKLNYQDEIAYILNYKKRNIFISKLAAKCSNKGTTLVLFNRIDHGELLANMINDITDNPVYYIAGKIKADERESIRIALNENPNAILVGSVQCVATGLNIPRLQNLILTHPSKSQIRVLQSIGRILRTHDDKSTATVFDIADNTSPRRKAKNYSLKHFLERVTIYNKERFSLSLKNIEL